MPRIRSIHPGLASDEAYMSMSFPTKAAWPLLWTECDDQGAFEWKPIVLKARIFPADNINFADILSELEKLNCIRKFSANGREYGAVRNFRRFQKPKKPNSSYPLPPEFRTYVALDTTSSEPDDEEGHPSSAPITPQPPPVPHQFPTSGGKPNQMEDGGWRMEDGEPLPERPKPDDDGFAVVDIGDRYAFEGRTIRLTKRDLEKWQATYPSLSLAAELSSLDEWASTLNGKWFHAVRGALTKRERESAERLKTAKSLAANKPPAPIPRIGRI